MSHGIADVFTERHIYRIFGVLLVVLVGSSDWNYRIGERCK